MLQIIILTGIYIFIFTFMDNKSNENYDSGLIWQPSFVTFLFHFKDHLFVR